MKTSFILPLVLLVASSSAWSTPIGEVHQIDIQCTSIKIGFSIGSRWKLAPNPNLANWKINLFNENWSPAFIQIASTSNDNIQIPNLTPQQEYHFVVEARTRRAKGVLVPIYRLVGELIVTTPECASPGAVNNPQPGDVRLRHVSTSRCIYGEPGNGAAVKAWGCWQDPAMAISLEAIAGADVRIRLRGLGQCVYGNPNDGAQLKSWGCWSDPNMVFVKDYINPTQFRLRHKSTGKCIYVDSPNGEWLKSFTCWDDSNMVWSADSF